MSDYNRIKSYLGTNIHSDFVLLLFRFRDKLKNIRQDRSKQQIGQKLKDYYMWNMNLTKTEHQTNRCNEPNYTKLNVVNIGNTFRTFILLDNFQ